MAKIPQYDNPVPGLQTSQIGENAAVQAARRSGAFFNQAAEAISSTGNKMAGELSSTIKTVGDFVVARAEHEEISHGAVGLAGLTNDLTEKLNNTLTKADVFDPHVKERFMADALEPELEKFSAGFNTTGGQKWAEARIEHLRNHFNEATTAGMASLAKQQVDVGLRITANTLSNAAVIDPSFHSVDMLLGQIDASVGGMVDSQPYLKGVAGQNAKVELTEKIREQIVKSAAQSAINKSPNPEKTAMDFTTRYTKYINGAEANSFAKTARSVQKMNDAYDRQTAAAERQMQADDGKQYVGEQISKFINADGTINAAAKPGVLKDLKDTLNPTSKNFKPGVAQHAEALFKFAQSEGTATESNPAVKADLQKKLIAGNLDPIDIIKAANDNTLSHADAGIMEGARKLIEEHPVNNPGLKAVFEGAKAALVVPTNHSDFMQDFLPKYLHAKTTNTLKPGDLNFSDPNSLVSKVLADHQPDNASKMQFKIMQAIGQGIGDINEQTKMLNAPQVPPGMKTEDAVAKYGGGTWVKNSKGDLVKLPLK